MFKQTNSNSIPLFCHFSSPNFALKPNLDFHFQLPIWIGLVHFIKKEKYNILLQAHYLNVKLVSEIGSLGSAFKYPKLTKLQFYL